MSSSNKKWFWFWCFLYGQFLVVVGFDFYNSNLNAVTGVCAFILLLSNCVKIISGLRSDAESGKSISVKSIFGMK